MTDFTGIWTGTIRVSELDVSRTAIYEAMRYGDATPDEYVCGLVEDVISEFSSAADGESDPAVGFLPAYMFGIVPAERVDDLHIRLGGIDFCSGKIICSYLDGMTHACVFVATAGSVFEEYRRAVHESGDIVKDFVVDAVGSIVAESTAALVEKKLAEVCPLKRTMPCSPGYCGWNIKEQKPFFSLFPESPCGIRLTDSCLMQPEKSVSGFFGLGEGLVPQPYRCAVCTNRSCYKNRNMQ